MRVSSFFLRPYWCQLFAPASLGPCGHQEPGQEVEPVPRTCLLAFGSALAPPGSSLRVLFPKACPSRASLRCYLPCRRQFLKWPRSPWSIPLVFPSFRARLIGSSTSGAFITGGLALGGLVFQRSRLPRFAKVPPQTTQSSERPSSPGLALWQLGSLWSDLVGDLSPIFGSTQSVGNCVLAFPGQWPLGLRPLGVWSSSFVSCRQVPPKVCSPCWGSVVSLFPMACLSDGVGSCGPALLRFGSLCLAPAVVLYVVASLSGDL